MSEAEVIVCLSDDDDCVIESVVLDDIIDYSKSYDYIYKENKLLSEFIEKCFELENTKGMMRIINKTLLPLYSKANVIFRKSEKFDKLLHKSLSLMDTSPEYKFNHIKQLCEALKTGVVQKRITPIKLSSNIIDNICLTSVRSSEISRVNRKRKFTVIDLDKVEGREDGIINVDSYQNNTTDLCSSLSNNVEKENKNNTINNSDRNVNSHVNKLLVPQKVVTLINDTELDIKVKEIEKKIERYNIMVKNLEDQEVDKDSNDSPYIKCEMIKEMIVKLYEELCQLTGEESVKRREVRLSVIKGHPAGPVLRLEQFLNKNIQKNGAPPFPDFQDVVLCVVMANLEDKLGWSRAQIMKEACALFTQCGKALQKRRQQRDWRDLLLRVKQENCSYDPADDDPVLQARLEANKQIALKKEKDLFERFSKKNKKRMSVNHPVDEESLIDPGSSTSYHIDRDDLIEETANNSKDRLKEMIIESSQQTLQINRNGDSPHLLNNGNYVPEIVNNDDISVKCEYKVQECDKDVNTLLEELGNGYTATVVEIEDPFVLIEISSDESDSEEK